MKGIKVKNIKIDFNKVVINKKFDDSILMLVWFFLGLVAIYVFHKEYYVEQNEIQIVTLKEEVKNVRKTKEYR